MSLKFKVKNIRKLDNAGRTVCDVYINGKYVTDYTYNAQYSRPNDTDLIKAIWFDILVSCNSFEDLCDWTGSNLYDDILAVESYKKCKKTANVVKELGVFDDLKEAYNRVCEKE